MADRVTQAEVLAIIDTDTADISAFITAANLLVTAKLADEDLGDDLLKEIERWLSAHFVCALDPRSKAEKIGDASVTYENASTGEGLKSTRYGQQVLLLDTSGTLAQLGKKKVSIQVDDFRDA